MKKWLVIFMTITLVLSGCSIGIKPVDDTIQETDVDEVRAIWLSYLDLHPMFAGRTKESYRLALEEAMQKIKNLGMNTVMYQVRPFGDALYMSNLFPSSYLVTGTEGAILSFDPLYVAIDVAKKNGLRIEAWMNPYRVRNANSMIPLSNNNIAKIWYSDGSRRVIKTSKGIMIYNPALAEVRKYIVNSVKEIIEHYAVDGIHFDDYFYPTTDTAFDKVEYLAFSNNGGTLTLGDYRRENVNKLIREVYQLIHSYDRDIVFGISPQGILDINYNKLYVDVPLWLSANGYVDYICPQVYFGFNHSIVPFEQMMDNWNALIKNNVRLIAGLAVYKVGQEDKRAGYGKREWIDSERILGQMINTAKSNSHYGGYALYRYDSLFKPSASIVERINDEKQGIMESISD
ncbi:family 10 glycosylhydrolase [Candidatus Halobeggiatoa sp. HSG11]|nr:family 10 glycosylhydrolase [Candidatus Halobeggiatoa sp. HSG11]